MIEFGTELSRKDELGYIAAIKNLATAFGNPKEVLTSFLVISNLYHAAITHLAMAYVFHQKTSATQINQRSEKTFWAFCAESLYDTGLLPLLEIHSRKVDILKNATKKLGLAIDFPELNQAEKNAKKRLTDHVNKNTRHFNKKTPEHYWHDGIVLSYGTLGVLLKLHKDLGFPRSAVYMSLYNQALDSMDEVCDAAQLGEYKDKINRDINNYFSREAEKHDIEL